MIDQTRTSALQALRNVLSAPLTWHELLLIGLLMFELFLVVNGHRPVALSALEATRVIT
jgi:hypothetical protein